MTWQPIETAPKDGYYFLAFYPAEDGEEAFYDVTSWPQNKEMARYYGLMRNSVDPTHWMPLPEPPQ